MIFIFKILDRDSESRVCSEAAGIQKTRNSHPRTRETRLYDNKLHAIVKPWAAWERSRLQASSLDTIVSFSLSLPLFVSATRRRLVTRASCYDYGKTPVIYMRHAECCQLDNPLLTRTHVVHTDRTFWRGTTARDDSSRAIIEIASRRIAISCGPTSRSRRIALPQCFGGKTESGLVNIRFHSN